MCCNCMTMDPKRKSAVFSFFAKCRSKTIYILELLSDSFGNAVFNHETWFVVVPALLALVLGVVALVTPKPQEPFASTIKDMFVLNSNTDGRLRRFENTWFGSTWAQVGYTSSCGQIIIRSRSKKNLLTDDTISEVLKLHQMVAEISTFDPLSNTTISYQDVCLKQLDRSTMKTAENGNCYLDPLLDVFQRSRNDKTQRLEILVDDEISAPYVEVGLNPANMNFPASMRSEYDYDTDENFKKVFLEKNIGLIDQIRSYLMAARAFHISYLLDVSNNTATRSSELWLKRFEEIMLNQNFDGTPLIAMTTESIGREWQSLIGLKIVHVIFLCCVTSLLLAIYFTFLDGICIAAFLAICSAASLAMTLGSTFTIHLLSIGTSSFNFVQAAVFVAAFQSLIQMRFRNVLLFKCQKLNKQSTPDAEEITPSAKPLSDVKNYVKLFRTALVSSFICYLAFIVAFLATSLASTKVLSFRQFSSTVCIGFSLNFVIQLTFSPACARLFERRLRQPIATLHDIVMRSRAKSLSSEAEERVLLEERPPEVPQAPLRRRRAHRKIKTRKTTRQKIKKKLLDMMQAYFEGVVTNYARPTTVLFYLTYLSFGYVGCLHFTEIIEPRMLLSPTTSAFNYLESIENDFKPFGPRFAVLGQFHGYPWQPEVLQELYRIHRGISSSSAVCRGLKDNWLSQYVLYGTQEEMLQTQQQLSDNIDNMAGYTFEYEFEPVAEEVTYELVSIPEHKNWPEIWSNFTLTDNFRVNYASDLVFGNYTNVKTFLQDDYPENATFSFRWVYEINDTVLPGEKRVLLEWFRQLIKERNATIVPEFFIHSSELNWWATIAAKSFDQPILILAVFGLVILAASLLLRTLSQTFFSFMMAMSMAFGVSGFLSFHRIGLDPFTLPCVVFALPYSNGLAYDFLDVFTSGNDGGRSKWSQIALRQHAAPNLICLLALGFSSLVLFAKDFYGFRAPLIGLIILVVIGIIHVFFFLPVMLTIFPPSKKVTRGLPVTKGTKSAQPSIRAVTDSRPHLHARRYFYDSQRAISFQSEEDPDGRIEHITCL